jgi:hypothetical protein
MATRSETFSRQCFDQPLLLAAVADRPARRIDAGSHRRIRHDTPIPDGVDQVVLADDAVPIADQVGEQIEHLRRDGDQIGTAM